MIKTRLWMKITCNVLGALAALWLGGPAAAVAETVDVPFDEEHWTVEAREHRFETFDGRTTLYVQGGVAVLDDVTFRDGVLEFEVMLGTERGFSGARWRTRDGGHYEEFYLRPHQSGNVDANQYQPVFHGVSGWQIYYGADFSVAATYRAGEWTKVRIEVRGDRAQFYIDSDQPVLDVDLRHETAEGGIALFSGFAPARFSRFRYEKTDKLEIVDLPERESDEPERKTEGLIRSWQVSSAVAEASLDGKSRLDEDVLDGLTWHALPVETNGIANLARVQGVAKDAETAFARLVLDADEATIQRLDFGFSDRVRIYTNRELLYWGSDRWQSRDYRFLGTVGTYSAVFLPLRKGRNEILLAVSESFGGWALTGNLVPEDGVRIVEP